MGLFGKTKGKGRDEYVAEAGELGAQLIDVREPSEFAQGHVEGAVNVPLGSIQGIGDVAGDKDALLYVYCRSGMRSSKAAAQLKRMGYANAVNIGGIDSYHGPVAR